MKTIPNEVVEAFALEYGKYIPKEHRERFASDLTEMVAACGKCAVDDFVERFLKQGKELIGE